MTGPDRIWINEKWEAYLRPTSDGDTSGYIRRDPAVIAALPEVQAMVAAAAKFLTDTVAEWSCGHDARHCDCWRDKEQWSLAAEAVEGLTHADATAALAARDAAMIARGMREAAEWYRVEGWKIDEDDVPGAILARAEQIEREGK